MTDCGVWTLGWDRKLPFRHHAYMPIALTQFTGLKRLQCETNSRSYLFSVKVKMVTALLPAYYSLVFRLFNDAYQLHKLYSVEQDSDEWIMNREGYGQKYVWPLSLEGRLYTTNEWLPGQGLNTGLLNITTPFGRRRRPSVAFEWVYSCFVSRSGFSWYSWVPPSNRWKSVSK